jgi:hypothetical protein
VSLEYPDDAFGKIIYYAVVYFNTIAFAIDNAFILQKCEMLRNSRLRQSETLPDMFHIALLITEPGYNLQSNRVTKYLQNISFHRKHFILIKGHR